MYQIFNSSTTTAEWLNIISAILTIQLTAPAHLVVSQRQ